MCQTRKKNVDEKQLLFAFIKLFVHIAMEQKKGDNFLSSFFFLICQLKMLSGESVSILLK